MSSTRARWADRRSAWSLPLLAACLAAGATPSRAASPAAGTGTAPASEASTATTALRRAPLFVLKDTGGSEVRLADALQSGYVVLEWFNPDCPFSRRHHTQVKTMAETAARYAGRKVAWFAVNSGAPGKQGAGVERNRKAREEYGIAYPVLMDEEGEVGRLYGAKTTPHMFLIAPDGAVLYQGAIDDMKDLAKPAGTNYVAAALEEALAGKAVSTPETRPYGCSVKYK